MTSVQLHRAAACRAVEWKKPLRLFTSAPLSNNDCVTSVLFFHAAYLSAVPSNPYSLSTGTSSSSNSFTKLASPSQAASVKQRMSSSSISRRETEITIQQVSCLGNSDEIVKVSFEQNHQSSNFFQTMMNMETKSFLVQITLSDMNKSQLFWKFVFLTSKYNSWEEIRQMIQYLIC